MNCLSDDLLIYISKFLDNNTCCTFSDLHKLAITNKYLFKIPKAPAWITFVTLIKQSIINILENKEVPGLYTLTCDDIYWHDLLNILGKKINLKPKFIIIQNDKKKL